MVGAPHFLSMTTLRPLGPSVTLTAFASASTPRSSDFRAESLNSSSLAIAVLRDRDAGGGLALRRGGLSVVHRYRTRPGHTRWRVRTGARSRHTWVVRQPT